MPHCIGRRGVLYAQQSVCRVSYHVLTTSCPAVHLGRIIVWTYVLVDQHDRNVLPLPGELVECFLDSGLLSFGIDDKVVLLRVWSFGDMLWSTSVAV
jgi:hypothetical protein